MARNIGLFFLALVLLGGCSRMTFVKQRFDDFSAYYNTFYNAEQALEEGIAGFDASVENVAVDQDQFISLFGRSESGTTQRQPFEDSILKCADVLRDHPNSKWVDDATLCIGKAWFYTVNFVGAERKFQEILALDSPLKYEAFFWLARTHIASGAYDEAYDHLQATLSGEDLSRRWEPQYRLALAELHVTREDWEEAAAELEAGLPGVRDSDLASRAQFLLGQVYEALGRYEDAVASYDEVERYKPWYELSYAAQYSAIRVLVEEGDAEEALLRLRKMERDDKNYDYRAYLSYMRGRAYQAAGDYDAALDHYDYLLYDRNSDASEVRGRVHYALAQFYRDVALDFQLAAAHFDTANTSLTSGGRRTMNTARGKSSAQQAKGSGQQAPGAITDAEEQARVYGSFATVMDRILLMDSLLYMGSLEDSTFDAIILELRQEKAAQREELRREESRRRAEEGFRGVGGQDFGAGFGDLPEGKDIGQAEMGFLYHRDEAQMQQAQFEFVSIWGERPLARNWRRIAAVTAVTSTAEYGRMDSTFAAMDGPGGELPTIDVSAVPRDSLSQAKMRMDRARTWYELGNALFLSMGMPDSAAAWYRMVIDEGGAEPAAQRAYYALAEVQLSLGDTLGADRIYREIVTLFPGTSYAVQAADHLGIAPLEAVISDTLALAETLYAENFIFWRDGDYRASLHGMLDAAQAYPATDVAPRALLAAGNIYIDWAQQDSLDLFAPLPLTDSSAAWMRRAAKPPLKDSMEVKLKTVLEVLQGHYPRSPQARAAGSIVEVLDLRWAAIMAPIDSLRRLDSLATADSLARVDSMAVVAMVDSMMVNDSLLIASNESRLAAASMSVLNTVSDSVLLVASDSLIYAARDSVHSGIRDSLYFAVKDSIAAAAAALAAALEQARADSIRAAQPQPPRRSLNPGYQSLSPVGSVDVSSQGRAPVGLEPTDPRMKGEQQRDPSLGNIDWSPGGYTVIVHRSQDYEAAVGFALNFGRTLPHPIDILGAAVERGVEFRVGMGLFETLSQAQQAMLQLEGQLPEDAEIAQVPKTSRI